MFMFFQNHIFNQDNAGYCMLRVSHVKYYAWKNIYANKFYFSDCATADLRIQKIH